MDFRPGALPYTPPADPPVDPRLAADIVWFDTLVTNVDRTHRNPNLIVWHGRIWLIDHGAAFFRQHGDRSLPQTAHDSGAALAPELDPAPVRSRLDALRLVVVGDAAAGALSALAPSERFGWLVAPSSTIIQPSEVHTGLTDDPRATLDRLFDTLVI